VRLQHDTQEATLNYETARNQQTVINRRLQLRDKTDRSTNRKQTAHSGRLASRGIVVPDEVGAIGHITVLASDVTFADKKTIARQIKRTLLYHQPGQTDGGDVARNIPQLGAKTVIGLEQLGLE
jgi:hypothetical protein